MAWSNKCTAAMVGGIPLRFREDCREGVNPPELIVGDFHQNWEECFFLIVVRSSSEGFPLRGGKALRTSRKRSVIALGIMTQTDFWRTGQGL
jgi:hypothetical protein